MFRISSASCLVDQKQEIVKVVSSEDQGCGSLLIDLQRQRLSPASPIAVTQTFQVVK